MAESRNRVGRRGKRGRHQQRRFGIAEFFQQAVLRAATASPHPVVYHYTTLAAARNIINTQVFWSTAHDCTNDEAELVSADSLVLEAARKCRGLCTTGATATVLDTFLANYQKTKITEMGAVYLSCFSLARDDAAQWREYGDKGCGTCLGIRVLEERGPTNKDIVSVTVDVDYSEQSLRRWLDDAFNQICRLLAKSPPSMVASEEGLSALYRIAAFASIRAKHDRWKSEREVRLVTFARRKSDVSAKERTSASGAIIRYLPISVRADGKLIAVDELIIGVNQNFEETREQWTILLATKGYRLGSIECPRITLSNTVF